MKFLEYFFGRKKTTAELLRDNKRVLNRAIRELDREGHRLEQQELKTILDMKRDAKQGQMGSVRILAKNLVRSRQYRKKFILMRANIQAVLLKIQGVKSQSAMTEAICSVTRVMAIMNHRMNLPRIQHVLADFERQTEIMDLKEDMVDEAVAEIIAEDNEEEEEALIQQVLDELGIQVAQKGSAESLVVEKLPDRKEPKKPQAIAIADEDADLQARLSKLRCH